MLPQYIVIQNIQIGLMYFFVPLALIAMLFIYWHEMRRDGFDEEKSLDLFFIVLFSAVVFSRFVFALDIGMAFKDVIVHTAKFWTPGYSVIGAMIGVAIPLLIFPKYWMWSFYRISDVLGVTASFGLFVGFFGASVISGDIKTFGLAIWFLAVFSALYILRLRYSSGIVFSLFLLACFFVELKLYVVLIIISLVNFYLRERKNPMKKPLPKSFINKVRKILKKKDKDLDAEQKLLIEEDPYMAEGRDTVDEYLDDVTEDIAKRESDLRLSGVAEMRIGVRKALAKIKIGKYGICDVCGEPIDIERLKAYPEATTCVKHST